MSAHLILTTPAEVQTDVVDLLTEASPTLPPQPVPISTTSRDLWLGILGLAVVMIILGLSLYSVVRFLL